MRTFSPLFLLCFTFVSYGQSIDSIRIMHYNILKYGESGCTAASVKDAQLRTIIGAYKPDIFTVNEMFDNPNAAINLRNNVLSSVNPNFTQAPNSNTVGSQIVNVLYYNADKFGLLETRAITGNIRDIDAIRLYYKPETKANDTLDLWCFVAHLKASFEYSMERGEAAKSITTWISDHPTVKQYIISGDFNLYNSSETAWKNFTGVGGGGDPFFYDPVNALSGWSGPTFAKIHTQSPSNGSNSCAVEGGMDNRFDFILVNKSIKNGDNKIKLLDKTYAAFGNDGVSFNQALNCAATTSVSASVCEALVSASDHLPVVVQLGFTRNIGVNEDDPYLVTILGNPHKSNENLNFTVETTEKGRYYWEIVDVLGRRMAADSELIDVLPNKLFEATVSNTLPAGQYFLIVRDAFSKSVMRKFIVY